MSVNFDPRFVLKSTTPNTNIKEMWEGLGEDWQAYTPVTTGITLGTGGTNQAWRKGTGARGQFHGEIEFGSGLALSTPTINVYGSGSSPFTQRWRGADMSPDTSTANYAKFAVEMLYWDSSDGPDGTYHIGGVIVATETMTLRQALGSSSALSGSVPFTWAAGDKIIYSASYLRDSANKIWE